MTEPRRYGSRVSDAPAYVLHTVPWRETSLIVELLTREYGRLACMAKGAKRPHSSLRGALLAFQPLSVGFTGGQSLRTLTAAQWVGGTAAPQGAALLCAFYLNELLLRLVPRDDPCPAVFAAYGQALSALTETQAHAATLRRFECVLLKELGYGPDLRRDSDAQPIAAEAHYSMWPGRGFIVSDGAAEHTYAGHVLLDMADELFDSESTLAAAKRLNRVLFNMILEGQPLKTRQILLDLHRL